MYIHIVRPRVHNFWTLGTNEAHGLVRRSLVMFELSLGVCPSIGLIRGWAHPRDSAVLESGSEAS